MPGVRPRFKPLTAGGSSGSSLDEVSQLELHLQRQLEEDIARIFDESIYSDLEVVCGKLKILTHSCILKARTHKFYHKLGAILHVNIGRNSFDEIYSFISDAYTECDIQHQEKEIISYLNDNFILSKPVAVANDRRNKQEECDESDAYETPNGVSPDETSLQKTLSSSPSTELTKEYYALVPIEGDALDKELVEQDELSSAFQSFIQLRTDNSNDYKITQCIKPTTLSLNSSHISKLNKHSIICDISKDSSTSSFLFDHDNCKITSQVRKHISDINKGTLVVLKKAVSCESERERGSDPAFSPDSLVIDEPSSSSDYLSAASPGVASSNATATQSLTKMNNTFNVSDSGIENNGMLESINSHKDVTLTDVSLTESTFHDLLSDESMIASNTLERNNLSNPKPSGAQTSFANAYKPISDMSGRSYKDEKQRQNEEIVILESSSVSSETGSWESVFPPKMPATEYCEKFLNIERQNCSEPEVRSETIDDHPTNMSGSGPEIAQSSPYKSMACFIDASSLVDEEEMQIQEQIEPVMVNANNIYCTPSMPVPCVPKQDISPIDISESNDNDDSLEQPDPDSMQKDISPTIFEMTLTSEDSYVAEDASNREDSKISQEQTSERQVARASPLVPQSIATRKQSTQSTLFMTSTPNNSIISLNDPHSDKPHCEGNYNGALSLKDRNAAVEKLKYQNSEEIVPTDIASRKDVLEDLGNNYRVSLPIGSDGVSLKDHYTDTGYSQNVSPMPIRKIENIPIVSGAYSPPVEIKSGKSTRLSSSAASSWIVDMSKMSKSDSIAPNIRNDKRPGDKNCEILKSSSNSEGCKSRNSVDSDSSEKSTHKFYIDLSTLPDALAPEQNSESEASNEKKNIFSMFIDLGDTSATVKEMPARFSSSLNTKKTPKIQTKSPATNTGKCAKKSPGKNKIIHLNDNFERLESLCNDPEINISEILNNSDKITTNSIKKVASVEIKDHSRVTRESIPNVIQEEPGEVDAIDLFVKLSDLDKPVNKSDIVITQKIECYERMTRSIPDNNWGGSSQTSSRSIDIISSFHSENALSLNRLFPHLKNDISRSMPGSLSSRTRSPLRLVSSSPGDRDDHPSDMSEISSVQSSMCRSVVEHSTTEDTSQNSSLISNCQSRLGQDLLRMFLEEIAPDVIVEVSGRRIKAHKCILSSRCQYFAGILSGGWVESAGNVIALPPFSFSVVHFALCHIYSGVSTIPDSISIVELATISDMLGLEGLKEAIMFTLKSKYCHHFHKPCHVCTAGVLECFPLSSVYGLDDLYRRCLRWITRHFHRVWPTKAFATLPSELLDKCYQEHILNLNTDNLVDTVYGCGITVAALYRSRWAEVVARMCRRLVNAAAAFAGARLPAVLATMAGMPHAEPPPPAVHALDDCLARAIDCAQVDELCRTYELLVSLGDDAPRPDIIADGVEPVSAGSLAHVHAAVLLRRCESALVRDPRRVLDSRGFKELPSELRRRMRYALRRNVSWPRLPPPSTTVAALTPPARRAARITPPAKQARTSPRRRESEPHAPQPQPPHRPNGNVPPTVRTTKAQEERAKFNLTKTNTTAAQARTSYGNTKPRYLEPKKELGPRKPSAKMLSSSESSRNSSPVLARVGRESLASRPRTADPSTDSLSDSLNINKYATYTKAKHTTEGSAPMTQQSKCQSAKTQLNKTKVTRIPVLSKRTNAVTLKVSAVNQNKEPRKKPSQNVASTPLSQSRNRSSEIKPSGSLMMATKSSSAKMVPKIVKGMKQEQLSKPVKQRPRSPSVSPIPIMERSGTFLKDEPTFGETSHNDIDE